MDADVERLMPLKPAVFEVLLTLVDAPRHGYAIMQEVEERTRGRVRLLPGTLYRFLHRLVEEELIVEVAPAADEEGTDRSRREYRLTGRGGKIVQAEAERLQATLAVARAKRVLDARSVPE